MLSPQVCYATKALAHLHAASPKALSVAEIAEATGIPRPFLAKIVQRLARRGLVSTRRGIGGGVAAPKGRSLGTVTLYDLCEVFEDPVVEPRCLIGEAQCSDERACPAHAYWSPQRKRTIRFLQRTTLREVARFETRAPKPKRRSR